MSPDTESVRVGDDRSSGEPEEHRRIRREGSQRDDGGNRDRDVDEGSRHGWVSSISDETVVEWACSLERDDQDVRSGIATTDRSRRWTSSTSDGPLDSRMGWEDESTGARERDEPVQGASTSGGFDWVGDGDDGSADGDSETEANDAGFRWVGEEDFGHDSPAEPGEDSPEAGRDGATAAESGTTSDRDGFDWIGDAGGPRASDGPEDEWTAWIQDDDALSWAKSLEERTRSEAEGGEVNWGELVDDYGIEPDEDGERN